MKQVFLSARENSKGDQSSPLNPNQSLKTRNSNDFFYELKPKRGRNGKERNNLGRKRKE